MEISNFADEQFVDADLLNSFAALISGSIAQIGAALHTPGLSGNSAVTYSVNGLNLTLNLPTPFRALFGSGTLAAAHGTTNGNDSSTYTLNCGGLVPTSGSVTVYVLASQGSVGLAPVEVVGPPQGHPDYDPSFAPFTLYSEIAATIAVSASTTAPDNVTTFEICRFSLSAGQVAITGVDQSHIVRVGAKLSQNGEVTTADLAITGVTAGSYISPNITVGADGRITVASAGNAWVTPIANEASARTSADNALQTNITSEASARTSADTSLQNAINLKAPLDSPNFTGNPTAPTPPSTDADTSIPTTAWVVSKIAAATTGVSSVVGATGAVSLTDLVSGGVAPLASPALTGNPTAPTPPATDNDTSIPTTAWVVSKIASLTAGVSSVIAYTGAVTLSQLVTGGVAPLVSPALSGNPTAPTPAAGDADTSIATTGFVTSYFAGLTRTNTFSGANTFTQTVTGNTGFTSAGGDAQGANFRAVGGTYGAILRNDGSNCYLLSTASGAPYGTWNAFRPFGWNLANGAVNIDGTGVGVGFGGGASFAKGVVITDTTGSASLSLTGNAGWKKTIRVLNGSFSIVNNAYTADLLVLDDAGNMSVPGVVTAAAGGSGNQLVIFNQLSAEATARNNADVALSTQINNETNARAAMFSGVNNVTGARAFGYNYVNPYGRPMYVMVFGVTQGTNASLQFNCGVQQMAFGQPAANTAIICFGIVPTGAAYNINNTVSGVSIQGWTEIA